MNYLNESTISPNWPAFSWLWKIVAIVLFLLLALLWLLNASPWSKNGGICAPAEKIVEVAAADTLGPMLRLNDNAIVHVPYGTNYSDAGAAAMDNVDGDISVAVTGNVDYNTPGEYVLTYTATDKAGNTSTTTRTVIVDAKAVVVEEEVSAVSTAIDIPAATLYFANASAKIPADTESSLETIIDYLKANSDSTAMVSGFHSAAGSYDYNQALSKRRAEAVSRFIQKSGVAADRMILEKPIETTGSGSPEEARRVEVSVRH